MLNRVLRQFLILGTAGLAESFGRHGKFPKVSTTSATSIAPIAVTLSHRKRIRVLHDKCNWHTECTQRLFTSDLMIRCFTLRHVETRQCGFLQQSTFLEVGRAFYS